MANSDLRQVELTINSMVMGHLKVIQAALPLMPKTGNAVNSLMASPAAVVIITDASHSHDCAGVVQDMSGTHQLQDKFPGLRYSHVIKRTSHALSCSNLPCTTCSLAVHHLPCVSLHDHIMIIHMSCARRCQADYMPPQQRPAPWQHLVMSAGKLLPMPVYDSGWQG